MAKADWTYQVAPAGSSAAGLEEYVVESSSGARVGKVTTLLRRGSELLLAVERGNPPVNHDPRVFPWSDVERVDHSALTIRLKLSEDAVEESLELDPDKGVENGDADAVRVTDLPAELQPPAAPATAGPVDRPTYAAVIVLGALGLLSLLALVLAATAVDFTWEFALFAIPVALFVAAGVAGYRVFRSPYAGR